MPQELQVVKAWRLERVFLQGDPLPHLHNALNLYSLKANLLHSYRYAVS